MDTDLRALERLAAAGDICAAQRLSIARERAGLCSCCGEATCREAALERERIQWVLGLTGGELATEPWAGEEYWYEGSPDWADEYQYRYDQRTFRTIVTQGLPADEHDGWALVEYWTSSGEASCPCEGDPDRCPHCGEPSEDGEPTCSHRWTEPCPLCEGDGTIYIGDGWVEALYVEPHRMPGLEGLTCVSTGWYPSIECVDCGGTGSTCEDENCGPCNGTGYTCECSECPEHGPDDADEGSFSRRECDACNSHLSGARYAAHGLDEGQLVHLDVCTDCLEAING